MHLSLSEVQIVTTTLHYEGMPQSVEHYNKGEHAGSDGFMVKLAACFLFWKWPDHDCHDSRLPSCLPS